MNNKFFCFSVSFFRTWYADLVSDFRLEQILRFFYLGSQIWLVDIKSERFAKFACLQHEQISKSLINQLINSKSKPQSSHLRSLEKWFNHTKNYNNTSSYLRGNHKLKKTKQKMDEELKKQEEDSYTYHFFFNHGVYDELKHYDDLISETEVFLKAKIIAIGSNTNEDIRDERFGKKIQYEGIFPIILWKSIFLSTYFLLENSLDQICKNLKKSNSYKLTLKDISGNGIFRSSLYLKKVCNIVEPFETETWTQVNDFNKIRNVFVHSDGILSKSTTDTIKICQKYNQIQLTEYDEENLYLKIDSEFCKYTLTKIEKLISDIHNGMQNHRMQLK